MNISFKFKVYFRDNESRPWLLYSKTTSSSEAKHQADQLKSLNFSTLVEEQSEEILLSEVDYLLGAVDSLTKELHSTSNFIDLHTRITTLTQLLIDAVRRERQGDVRYIPSSQVS